MTTLCYKQSHQWRDRRESHRDPRASEKERGHKKGSNRLERERTRDRGTETERERMVCSNRGTTVESGIYEKNKRSAKQKTGKERFPLNGSYLGEAAI